MSTSFLVQVSGAFALGLVVGYPAGRAVQQGDRTWQSIVERLALIGLALAGTMVVARSYYRQTPSIGAYCLGLALGFLGLAYHRVPKGLSTVFLDAIIFLTLCCAFSVLVISNARISLTELPASKWIGLVVGAGSFGLSLAIILSRGLAGKWPANPLIALSALLFAFLEVPQWFDVMRSGFVYMDMPTAFVYGLPHFLTCLLIWPLSFALCIAGLIVAYKRTDCYTIVIGIVQLCLMTILKAFYYLLPE